MRGYAVRTLFVVAGVSILIGCGSVGAHSNARGASSASGAATRDAELTALRVQNEEQEQDLRTLRGQLALARSEVQELKGEKQHAPARGRNTSGGDELPWAKDKHAALEMQIAERLLQLSQQPPGERIAPVGTVEDNRPCAFMHFDLD